MLYILNNNIRKVDGSSETTREKYFFNLKFIEWFIGFSEGDGSFIINSTGYLEFKITQSSLDSQVLFKIKSTLGFGSVFKQDKNSNTHHYRVRRKEHILIIINIFNGNMLLNKTFLKFSEWVVAYNIKYKANITILAKNPINFSLLSAWLMGFLEAEGCFNIYIIRDPLNNIKKVRIRFMLSQKDEYEFFLLY